MDRAWYETTRAVLKSSPFENEKTGHRHNAAIMSRNVKTQMEDMWLLNLAFEPNDMFEDLWTDSWTRELLIKRGNRTFGGAVMQHGLWHASWSAFERAAQRCEAVFNQPLELEKLPSHFGEAADIKNWMAWFKTHPPGEDRDAWMQALSKHKLLLPL